MGGGAVSSDRWWKERGGHTCADVTMDELPPPPEWLMQRPEGDGSSGQEAER